MVRTNCASVIVINILQLLLIYNCRLFAAVLTYDGCMSDKNNSYTVGGWCFYIYRNASWTSLNFPQTAAQTVCQPHGTLAVGVTYKMLTTFNNNYTSASYPFAWLALNRNSTSAKIGWYWNARLPNGGYATFPAIMSNIPWGAGWPDNSLGNEYAAIVSLNEISDVPVTIGAPSKPTAAICQFAPLQWSYTKMGHGRFGNSTFRIAQTTVARTVCILQCHRSVFCISLAFNPTTNDCQIYGASPKDPLFAGNVIADSSYDFHVRDGMEY